MEEVASGFTKIKWESWLSFEVIWSAILGKNRSSWFDFTNVLEEMCLLEELPSFARVVRLRLD